jgi:peptide/nickel transport system permease protein
MTDAKADQKAVSAESMKPARSSPIDRPLAQVKRSIAQTKKSLTPRLRELRYNLHMLRKSKLAMVGLVMILVIIAIAILAPVLAPTLPNHDSLFVPKDFTPPKPPGSTGTIDNSTYAFPMGSGSGGEDIYYGVIWGARTSIYTALTIVGISALIGIILGAIAGYYGGIVDEVLMRVTDIFLSLPALILAMAVVAVLSRTLDNIILALIITWWPAYARLVRGQVLSVRENTYVEAARAVGANKNRILFRHIVPNSLSPMIVQITMDIGVVVLVAAGLSFIGFSQPGIAEWGRLVSEGQQNMFSQYAYPYPGGPLYNPWWMWVFPSIFIFIFVMGFNLLGDGLRDILDPRLRR